MIENRPGGMQNVGARACQDSAPDGYTICIINADPMIYNQFLIKDMPFDPVHGLQPITKLFDLLHVLVVNSDLKVKNVDELVALSKARPGHVVLYDARRADGALHGNAEEGARRRLGARAIQGRRRGGERDPERLDADRAVRRRQCHRSDQGRHHDLAGDAQQHPLAELPQSADLKEIGYNGPPSRGWYGLFAPAGTPRPIVDRIAKEVAAIVADPDFAQKQLTDRSLVGATDGPDEFAKQIEEDRTVAEQVVKQAGMGPELMRPKIERRRLIGSDCVCI